MHTQRKIDVHGERILSEYLDKYFYPRIDSISKWERIFDEENQYSGVDVIATYKGREIYIDEKGYLSRTKPMPTFAFELSRIIKNGERQKGWLYDDNLKTTHYLICWNKRNEDIELKDLKVNDFHYIMVMLIEKKGIHKFLVEKFNITDKVAEDTVVKFTNGIVSSDSISIIRESKTKYRYSQQLPEKPINIVVNKDELKEICDFYLCIKRSGIFESKF